MGSMYLTQYLVYGGYFTNDSLWEKKNKANSISSSESHMCGITGGQKYPCILLVLKYLKVDLQEGL